MNCYLHVLRKYRMFTWMFLLFTLNILAIGCSRNRAPVIDPAVTTTSTQENKYDSSGSLVRIKLTLTLEVKASDPDGDPLHYEWTETGGTLKGSKGKASWEGARKGDVATVTVTDGRGGTAAVNFEHAGVETRTQIIYQ